jgi:hypothetical protein
MVPSVQKKFLPENERRGRGEGYKGVQYWDKFAIFARQMVTRTATLKSAKFHPLPDF